MKRKRIVFASVLKPVDDPRTYLKLAKSLVPSGKYDVNIIGFPVKTPISDSEINFIPLDPFPRKSLKRLMITSKIYKIIRDLDPDLLVINTHELLGVAAKFKRQGVKIIYDIRENYSANIRQRKHMLSDAAAWFTRRKERRSVAYVDHYILAEKCYSDELEFTKGKSTILENKATLMKPAHHSKADDFTFIFTGTLARHTGILESIDLVRQVRSVHPTARLMVRGNSFDTKFLSALREIITREEWIDAKISEAPLPYTTILEVFAEADAAIISYEPWVHKKMPTKLYEYISCEIPIILIRFSPEWKSFCDTYPAAVVYDSSPDNLLKSLENITFYSTKPGAEVRWIRETTIFSELTDSLL